MPIRSRISPDSFVHIPSSLTDPPSSATQDPALLFFITGNPGLIGYYHPFLSLISQSPSPGIWADSGLDTSQCVIVGLSLGGFELEERGSLHSLQNQITLTFSRIRGYVAALLDSFPNAWTTPPRVILLGHSVGAFIALELIRSWHHTWRAAGPDFDLPEILQIEWRPSKAPYEIIGAILLTPTIIDIAKSASGQIATPLLNYLPFFPSLLQVLARGLTLTLPDKALRWLLSKVTKMQDPALSTTISFLGSQQGVKQSLTMARDEMREITQDRFGEEVWGITSTSASSGSVMTTTGDSNSTTQLSPPKLVFYFASKDHWVADATREEILRIRGSGHGKAVPKMVIEEEGKLVHGWCITQSDRVAEKVRLWVGELLPHGA